MSILCAIELPSPMIRMRRTWARDIAMELRDRIMKRGCRHTLFIHPDGHVDFMRGYCANWEAWSSSLVGVYDVGAQIGDVIEDILAMQREPIDGRADA